MVHKTAGFTLMELLVGMAIMGILAGVGFTAYTSSLQKTHDAKRKSDLEQVTRALEAYQTDFGVYPAAENGAIAGCGNGIQDAFDGTEPCDWGEAFSLDSGKVYMRQLPEETKGGSYYVYVATTDRRKYQIFARLDNLRDSEVDETLAQVCADNGDTCNYGVASPNATINEVLQ